MNALVRINDVHKYFTRGSERIDVLQGVNLEIPQGDFLALMGPSGSGQDDAAQSDGRPRQAVRADRSRSAAPTSRASPAGSCRAGAREQHRLRVSALQPAARSSPPSATSTCRCC